MSTHHTDTASLLPRVAQAHYVRGSPLLTISRSAKPSNQSDVVMETFEGVIPEEVLAMLKKLVSSTTKNPARLTVGTEVAFKDYGAGWGAFVALSFDVDPDEKTLDAANDEVGALVRNYVAEHYVKAEDLYRTLRS